MTEALVGQAVETPPREPLIEIEDLTVLAASMLEPTTSALTGSARVEDTTRWKGDA